MVALIALSRFLEVSVEHIKIHGHNWKVSSDLWPTECRGFLQRHHMREHGQRILKYRNIQSIYNPHGSTWRGTQDHLIKKKRHYH